MNKISIKEKKPYLIKRALIIDQIRQFFKSEKFLEIETPYIVPSPGTEFHINAFSVDSNYLIPSPEYQMKRLLSYGYDKIFQIARCYRKGERGDLHLPEYSMLEWYILNHDYNYLMKKTEEMILFIAKQFSTKIKYGSKSIDLNPPWIKLSINEALIKYTGKELNSPVDKEQFFDDMLNKVEPNLPQNKPVFLYDWPINLASLARQKKYDPRLAERVELYIAGLEIANGFSELVSSEQQKNRCLEDLEERKKENKPIYPLDQKFITSLDFIFSAAGIALGVDRLVMLFCDAPSIDYIVSFTPEEL